MIGWSDNPHPRVEAGASGDLAASVFCICPEIPNALVCISEGSGWPEQSNVANCDLDSSEAKRGQDEGQLPWVMLVRWMPVAVRSWEKPHPDVGAVSLDPWGSRPTPCSLSSSMTSGWKGCT